MSNRDDSLLWAFIEGVVIGWILLGVFKLIWLILKALWWLFMWVVDTIRGKSRQRRIVTFERAEALEAEGYLGEAAEIYRALANSGDTGVRAHALSSLAWVLERQQSWDEAIDAYRLALAQREPEVSPLAMLGIADVLYLGKHERSAAVAAYRELLIPGRISFAERADRESIVQMARKHLASVLYEEGEFREAEQLCRKVIESDTADGGNDVGLTIGLARVMAKQGKVDDALLLLGQAAPTTNAQVGSRRGCPLFLSELESMDDVVAEIAAYERAV